MLRGAVRGRAFVGDLDCDGGEVLLGGRRLDALSGVARVRLARAGEASIDRLSGRLSGRLHDHPFVVRGRLRWRAGRVDVDAGALSLDGATARGAARYDLHSHRLSVHTDPVSIPPALAARLLGRRAVAGGAWIGHADLAGTGGNLTLAAQLDTPLGRIDLAAHVRGSGGSLEVSRAHARLGDSHLDGALRYRPGHLSASVDELVLAPSLVSQLVPQLQPAWPIHLRGAVDGPRDALEVALAVDAGPSTARLRGRIAHREFRIAGHLDTFDLAVLHPTQKRVRATLELLSEGRVERGAVTGTLSLREARGYMMESPFFRGRADARLLGRGFRLTHARVELPGAKVVAQGHGELGKGLEIDYGVVITNALALRRVPRALRLFVGIDSILPGRSAVGSITKRLGRKVELSLHVLPIGISQLNFLFRVITGRLPSFDELL
jgi:hypothetical protein